MHRFVLTIKNAAFLFGMSLVTFPTTMVAKQESMITQQTELLIKGKIVDTNHEPVIGASVQVMETGKGVATDLNGTFQLKAPGNGRLQISCIGYEKQIVSIKGRTELTIVLRDDMTNLDEVVVVGYGTMKKREMTSAISHVGEKDFNNLSSLDASMLIQGKVSSVSIVNTGVGDPNQQASIQIRGISSRNAGLGPLIVVDGIPDGNLTNINPEDIESIDVLKDGAASAIYGTRGSNGVILVNLKKSKKDGKIHTSYSTSLTLNKAKKELELLTADQFRAYRAYENTLLDKGGNTDWFDEITRLGVSQKHTLTFSGGNDKTNYRVTADYRDANGIDLRSNRREYGARLNVNHTTKGGMFTFTANIAPRVIDRDKSDWSVFSTLLSNNPTAPVFDSKGNYTDFTGEQGSNVVEKLRLIENGTEIKLLAWDASAQMNLLPLFNPSNPDMVLKTQLTISQQQTDKFGYYYSPSTLNDNKNSGIAGSASREFDKSTANNLDWIVNFSTRLKDHQIRAMLGYSYSYGVSSGMDGMNKDFASDALSYNNLGAGEWLAAETGRTGVGSYKNDHTLIGFFGRVNYDYKEKYMLSASLRHEGSSRFGKDNKWGNFPAVSVGWRLSAEPFMRNLTWINDLKLRYDYGVTGNQDIGNYKSLATYRAFGQYQYNGTSFNVWGPGKNTNTAIRWEKGYNQNIGLDFSLFNNILTGSVNYFHRKQVDLLGDYDTSLPPNLFGSIYANVGSVKNTGFEFDLTVNAINRKDFKYYITLVGSTNNNEFVDFSNDVYDGKNYYWTCSMSNPNNPGYLQRIEVGQRIGNYVTYRYAGISESGDWLIYNKNGDVIPISQGTEEDKSITGNGLPKFTGSITNSITWKNFDMSISFRGAFGFDLFNVHDFYFGLQSGEGNLLTNAYRRNAKVTTGKNVISDYFIERGDYWKLDAITLGYTFNLNHKFIDRVRVFGTANNLYTWTKFTGVDPSTYEVNGLTPGTFGGGYNYYPSTFQFVFGLQVGF